MGEIVENKLDKWKQIKLGGRAGPGRARLCAPEVSKTAWNGPT